jgi:serine/threonine protein kinase
VERHLGHHYLHVNPDVKLHLGNQLPGDGWIELIVSDLTENGTQLSAIVLPTNEFGPQIALYGDQFFARASTDKFRPDTLWVYRVESGRNPNQVPVKIAGRFEPLIAGRPSPPRDPVAPLFGTSTDVTFDTEPERVLRLKPSARLTKILASMPATVRAAWRPSVDVPVQPLAPDFLRTLRSLWARYKLARFTSPTAREEWLLRGQLTTGNLPNDERLALAALVDVGTLNALAATSEATRESLGDFLRRLAELVPPSDVRAAVWGAMLAGASDVEVRDEIRSSAAGLRALVENPIAERAWTRATLDGLAAAATRNTDAAITELLQKVEGDTHPLLGIASWGDRLESVSSNDAIESAAVSDAPAPTVVIQTEHLASAPTANGEPEPLAGTAITPEGDAAARWALEKCVGDLKPFATSLESLRTAAAVFDHGNPLDTPDSIVGVINHLETLAAETRHCLEQLPSKSQLEIDLSEATRVHAAARTALGKEFDPSQAPFDTLSVPELAELVDLIERDSQLVALPPWAWHSKNSGDSTPVDCPTRSERLCDPAVRRLVSQIVTLMGDFGDVSPSAIVKISRPPTHVAPDEHMRLELEQLRLAAQRLQRIPQEHREWMQLALARGDDEEETLQLLERFQALGMRLPSETAKALREDVLSIENPASRENRLHQYEQAVKFFEESLGTAQDVTGGQLNKRLERMYQTEAPALPAVHDLAVDHNWVGTTKTRAPLVFVAHEDPTRPYGFVSVPVAFESHRRWEYHLRVDVRVRTKQRGQSWLQEWDKHTPETLDIGVQDWRRSAEGRFVYTFELRIAIRRPERNNEAFEFSLQVTDLISGRAIAPEKSLRWESIEVGFEPLAFDWPGGIRPDYVKAHPVGPQKRLDRIEARLRGGTGFAVVAPRRFGKTTLVEYLRERATSLHLVCPEPIVCTSFTDDRGLVDLSSIWRTVAENLQSSLQCTVAADLKSDLPSPHAFDRARRAAAHAGSKGILLLFDESQLMFSPATGARIGDRLKDLLERNWMAKPTTESVPILFGFVGLPSFSSNVGVNFRNLLEPEEGWEMDDDDINRIILAVTKNKLHTTREARQHLAQVAPNLYLARILVESLRDRANKLQRAWVNYDDVAAVQADIARQLELGRYGNIAGLVRDALNDSPDVNRWQPSPSYPVALALALARHDGVRGAQPLAAHARQRLNAWCDDQQFGSGKPSYREEDVKRHLDRLSEFGVFDRSDFRSRFVEAWLIGEAREGFPSSAINSLVKGASTIVSIPQLVEPVEREGGQARIFRFTRDGAQYALRLSDLKTESERNRFLEAVATLKTLTTGVPRGEPGIQYIFDLDAVGFSERDEMVGVHVYRWIDGQDLQSKVGQLPAGLVAEIGMKLAIALHLLHRYRINHRDVRPKNIVLAHTSKDPILIDFGLAKFDGGHSTTRVSNDCTAPEVANQSPKWTSAADVYALGATLRTLLCGDDRDQAPMRELLERMTLEAADGRPDANELVSSFDALRARYLVDEQLRSLTDLIDAAVRGDSERRWYPPVVEKFKPTFRMLALGLHADMFDRCAELADFLNQVLEAYPVRRGGVQLKLGYVKNQNDDTGDRFRTMAIEALHQLRISLSHGDPGKSKSSVLRKLSHPNDNQLREWVREGAELIADHLAVPSLTTVIGQVL